jgi:replicative DNA helicase
MSNSSPDWQTILERDGPPRDVEAEKTILGSIQLNNDLIKQAIDLLSVNDFFLDSHRVILASMSSLYDQNMGIDLVTLQADLHARCMLEQVGGMTYLASLIDGVPRTDTIEPYARIVKRKSRERDCFKQFSYALDRLADDADLENVLADMKIYCEKASEDQAEALTGVYSSLFDLFNAELQEAEQIFLGLRRGEVAAFEAVTNYGKSTFLMNLCLSLAALATCIPLSPYPVKPRRILFIDCESPASVLQKDLKHMLRQIWDTKLASQNFIVMVDVMVRGEPLCLSRREHFERVVRLARTLQVDVIVIDTVASAFEIQDENANAEVTRKVMNPLKRMAREGNCGVVFTHHIGKAGETQSGEGAYKGRGASAFGALSRTVFTLEKDAGKGPGYVVLSCPKSKGSVIEPTLLKLNPETRWFEICEEKPTQKPEPPNAQGIADFIADGEYKTEEICRHFKDRAGERTIRTKIKEAESLGLIYKLNKQGKYRIGNGQSLIELPIADSPKVIPINEQSTIGYCECGASGIRFTDCEKCDGFIH